jgi:hypothetical protein
MVFQVAVAVGGLRFQLVIAERIVWGGAPEKLDRTTILHSEEWETQNQYGCRSTSEIRGWRCGFMLRTGGDEAEI